MRHLTKHIFINDEDGEIYLAVCPKCKRENDVNHVPHGVCAWCGYDAHELINDNDSLKANN